MQTWGIACLGQDSVTIDLVKRAVLNSLIVDHHASAKSDQRLICIHASYIVHLLLATELSISAIVHIMSRTNSNSGLTMTP